MTDLRERALDRAIGWLNARPPSAFTLAPQDATRVASIFEAYITKGYTEEADEAE